MGLNQIKRDNYKTDLEEEFLTDAILDLKHGNTTYVYKEYILNKLKEIFNDLEITREDFYWEVKNKGSIETKKGRPRKVKI